MKFDRLGWVVAAVLVGGIVGMGFQAPAAKTGTVDLAKVFNESEYAKQQTEGLRNMGASRQDVIDFVRTYRSMKAEDATKFKDLTLKANASATEKAELERLKNEGQAAETKYRELSTKASPSQAELAQIEEMNRRKDATGALLEQWQNDFAGEIQTRQESLRNDTLGRVKAAIQQVARDQGYTMVFDQAVAPYSANDITAEALKAMNAKK